MNEGTGEQRDHIISHLKILIDQTKRQMSVWHVFRNGVIYGMGFIIGSTVLTAIIVSIGLQFLGDTILGDVINWIAQRENGR